MAIPVTTIRTVLSQHRGRAKRDQNEAPPSDFPIVDQYARCELESSDFFCCLSGTSLKALQKIKHTMSYPAGTIIFTEGQLAKFAVSSKLGLEHVVEKLLGAMV